MSDSGVHSYHTAKSKFSSVTVQLFLAFAGMWALSFICYVIFINKLTHLYAFSNGQAQVIEKAKNNANQVEAGMQHAVLFLQKRLYTENLPEAGWEQVREKEISRPLDSLQVLMVKWNHPEGRLIYRAIRLSFHTYNKLLSEAYLLSENTARIFQEDPATEAAFLSAKKVFEQKITGEIQTQAIEISQQLQDLRRLLEAEANLQQQAVENETGVLYAAAIMLFLPGIIVAFLLARLLGKKLLLTQNDPTAQIKETIAAPAHARHNEANLSAVLNNTNNGILAVDTQFKITVINKSLSDKYAVKGIHLNIGSDYSQIFADCTHDWKAPYRKAFAGESFTESDYESDTDIYTETCYNPVKDDKGKVIGASLFIQDVSERKYKEIQIKNLLEETDLHAKKMIAQESILLDTLNEMQESQEALQHKEARLSAVINNTDDRIIAIDTEFKITVINAAMQEQYSRNGIFLDVGTDYRVIYKDVDEKQWLPDFKRAFAGEKFIIEQTITGPGILEIAFNPIINQKGTVTGVCLFIHDITDRVSEAKEKQRLYLEAQETTEELQTQQEELRQNLEELISTQEELEKTQKTILLKEARLRALITNTTDAIFSVDTKCNVTVINNAMQEHYEHRYIPIKEGENFLKSLPAGKKQIWKNFFSRALAGEQYTTVWEDAFDLKSTYYELSLNPVKTDQEEIIGVSVFMRDITDRKKQEVERLELLRQAEERQEEMMSQQEILRDNLQELMHARDALETKEAQLSSQINAINKSNNILELDLNGTILDANDSFLHLVDYNKNELTGKSYQVLIPEGERDSESNQVLWSNLVKGEFYTGEFKRITKGKEIIWIKATYNPVLNAQGQPYKIIKFAYDITTRVQDATEKKRLYEQISRDAEELRMQEEELRQNLEELKVTQEALVQQKEHIHEKEARLRALIDNTEDDIYAIDTKYTVTVLNKAVQARYAKKGLTLELGFNIFSIIPKTNTAYWKVNFDKAMSGEKFSIVDQVVTNDGEVFYDVSFNPIRNDKNQVIGVSVLSRNINQYKMAEKENLQTIDILRKIQDKVASMNNDREKEIEDYKKKVERLRKEMNGNVSN